MASVFFETLFGLEGLEGEQQVCCPFPHRRADGTTYKDHNPSMSINLTKGVYRCMSCGESGNDTQMCAKLFNIPTTKAGNFITMLNQGMTEADVWQMYDRPRSELAQNTMNKFGITDEVLQDTMTYFCDDTDGTLEWNIPVLWNGKLVDVRHYHPGHNPKLLGEQGAPTGLIVPHDKWLNDKRATILCAGEKDMLVTRSRGFNAITFTGGEMLTTPLDVQEFKNKRVAICYDNDQAGRVGAEKMARILTKAGAEVRVITEFHKDFATLDTKEDLTDWFTLYGGTRERLLEFINNTPVYVPPAETNDKDTTIIKAGLDEVLKADSIGKTYMTRVQVLTVSDDIYDIPEEAKIIKCTNERGKLAHGAVLYWTLNEYLDRIFSIVGHNETNTYTEIRACVADKTEKGLAVQVKKKQVVSVATVAEVNADFDKLVELTVACIGFKPVQGKVYDMTYLRITNHGFGTAAGVTTEMKEVNDVYKVNTVDESVQESLLYMQHHTMGSVADKIDARAKAVRGILGYEADIDMIKTIDLSYNSCKEFDFLNSKGIKGYMDTLIIGESRVGKSDTAKHLREAYAAGTFVSLAGSAATLGGIVGGSLRDSLGKMSTRAGILPRSNGSIVLFEELSKAGPEILRSLTDVRSSGLARITRVSGSIEIPAACRMVSMSNARTSDGGNTRPIKSYTSGLEVVQELVGAAEDIARYDLICLVGDVEQADANATVPEAIPDKVLQDCLRWAWSRTKNQIKFDNSSDLLINQYAKELNDKYPCNVKLFGAECWKKLARLSIAAAAYTISASSDFDKLIVTPEHVTWAKDFMEHLYTSPLFKLDEAVAQYKEVTVPTVMDTMVLQQWYIKYHEAFDCLYKHRKMDKSVFSDIANMETRECNAVFKMLTTRSFITQYKNNICVTEKYLRTYRDIQKEHEVGLATHPD